MNAAIKPTAIVLSMLCTTALLTGCDRKERAASTATPATAPSASPVASPSPEPPPNPIALPDDDTYPIQEGWVEILEKAEQADRAWVEGTVEGGEKIVITTQNVLRFKLDLARLRVDWTKRIVLRMDGFNSELTRKRWPVVEFVRTPSGAWAVVDD